MKESGSELVNRAAKGRSVCLEETLEVRVSAPPGSTFSGEEQRQKMRFDRRGHWPQCYFGP